MPKANIVYLRKALIPEELTSQSVSLMSEFRVDDTSDTRELFDFRLNELLVVSLLSKDYDRFDKAYHGCGKNKLVVFISDVDYPQTNAYRNTDSSVNTVVRLYNNIVFVIDQKFFKAHKAAFSSFTHP